MKTCSECKSPMTPRPNETAGNFKLRLTCTPGCGADRARRMNKERYRLKAGQGRWKNKHMGGRHAV